MPFSWGKSLPEEQETGHVIGHVTMATTDTFTLPPAEKGRWGREKVGTERVGKREGQRGWEKGEAEDKGRLEAQRGQ